MKKISKQKSIKALLFFVLIILLISVSYHYFFSFDTNFFKIKPQQDQSYPNILFITIDTLRADHLSCYGYKFKTSPNIDNLAKKSYLCTNVLAQVPLTLPSHATIFTGKSPLSHGIKNNANFILDESQTTLAEILKSKGYRTAAFIGGFPLISYFGLNQGFNYYDDNLNAKQYQNETSELERNAKDVTDAALSWLSKKKNSQFFVWIHFYDPHLPYTPPRNHEKRFESRYDAEISFVDDQIGRIMRFMEDAKLSSRTIIVITSDHGEGLGDHNEEDHGIFLYNSTLEIPLIIKPAVKSFNARRVSAQVSTQDIMPTILEMVGIPPLEGVDGISLVPILKSESDPRLIDQTPFYIESYYPFIKYKWSVLRGIIWNGYKFIDAPENELYYFINDRKELHNIYHKNSKIAKKMEDILGNILENSKVKKIFTEIDKEMLEKLKSLGYVGSESSYDMEDYSSLPDPKSRILILKKIDEAKKLMSENKFKSAISLLKKAMKEDDTNPVIYNNLGIAFRKLGEREKAFKFFNMGLKHDPDDPYLHNNLGLLYREQGELSLAIKEYQAAINNNPLFLGAYFNLSVAQYLAGHKEEAIKAIKKVLKEDPDFPEAKKMLSTFLSKSE